MQTWLTALIAGGAAVLSASVTTGFAMWTARREREQRGRAELQAVLASYLYALERLALEIGRMPPAPGRVATGLNATVERSPMLNWSIGQASLHTIGRPVMRAVDALMAAATRLTLVAPAEILQASEPIADLLNGFGERDAAWEEQFAQARRDLVMASRTVLAPEHTGRTRKLPDGIRTGWRWK